MAKSVVTSQSLDDIPTHLDLKHGVSLMQGPLEPDEDFKERVGICVLICEQAGHELTDHPRNPTDTYKLSSCRICGGHKVGLDYSDTWHSGYASTTSWANISWPVAYDGT